MIEEIDQETFNDLWKRSDKLVCPLTRGHPDNGYVWLYNKEGDPCKTKRCHNICCHSFGEGWDKHQKLWIPTNSKKEIEKP